MKELTPDDFVVPDGHELVGKPVMGTGTADPGEYGDSGATIVKTDTR